MAQSGYVVPPSAMGLRNKRRLLVVTAALVVFVVAVLLILFLVPLASSSGGEATSLSTSCGPTGCVPARALPMAAGSATSSMLTVSYSASGAAVELSVVGGSGGSIWSSNDLTGSGAFSVHGNGPYTIQIELSPSGSYAPGATVSSSIALSWTATGPEL
jgi:hypothetical protein